MAKFTIKPTILSSDVRTVRLGAGSGASNHLTDAEKGKFAKLVGESRYNLVAVGDEIEAVITSVEGGTTDDFTIGGIASQGYLEVTFDGIQVDGTGTIAVGDIVVAGTPVAKGTALAGAAPKVRKATTAANVVHKWRVVSLGTAASGAAGTTGVIERI